MAYCIKGIEIRFSNIREIIDHKRRFTQRLIALARHYKMPICTDPNTGSCTLMLLCELPISEPAIQRQFIAVARQLGFRSHMTISFPAKGPVPVSEKDIDTLQTDGDRGAIPRHRVMQ